MREYLSKALLLVFILAIAWSAFWFGVALYQTYRGAPACWEAPPEAFKATGTVSAGYWLFETGHGSLLAEQGGAPLYCVEWWGDFETEGRPRIASRCWPSRPLSLAECSASPKGTAR